MERRDNEDFRRPFIADSPLQNNLLVPSQNHRFRINGSHVPSNPNCQNPALQYPDLFQNPILAQRYSTTQYLPQASERSRECGLENSFGLLNLNVPCNNHSQLLDLNVYLYKMRIDSAVRGQMGMFHERFVGHSNSTSLNAGQDLVGGGAISRSATFPSTPIGNHDFNNSQRRSQSLDELASACPRRLINNPDRQYRGNAWPRNSSSLLPSSMYNRRPVVYPHQRMKYSSLKEFKGQICSLARDQHGCRFLQKKFDLQIITNEEIEMILLEVKVELHDLMVNQFANYLIQKLFEAGTQEQRTELLLVLVSSEQRCVHVCTDVHGTRVVQKFMERVSTPEQRSILLSMLKPIAVTLTIDVHGHHIIEQCLNKFSNEHTKHLVDEIVEHCLDIATDKSGCCVLQQCLAHAKAEARERLLAEITANAFVLSEHPYGNYVVQYVLGMKVPHVTSNLIEQLGGCHVTLSMNRFGSNVVEKCLKDAGEEHSARIITEIIHDPDFLKVIQDPFGNYVVQSALSVSKGDLHNTLVQFIQHHYPFLHSHLYGKKVLARAKERKNRV